MTGLKSGSGDDLWGDEDDDADDAAGADVDTGDSGANDSSNETATDRTSEQRSETPDRTDAGSSVASDGAEEAEPSAESTSSPSTTPADAPTESSDASADDGERALDVSSIDVGSPSGGQPYIVRRAVQDKSVQFERDERLTFFVHDDVADGERDLITDLESALGRDLPKFDVREAVYRAALRNPEAVLEELLAMGYSADEG